MTALHSTRWHRVRGLAPKLAPQVRVRRQCVRGQTWYVLADPAARRSVRLNGAAYAIAGRFDGSASVQQLWERQFAADGEPATQDEVIELLARLREAGLLQFDGAADFELLLPHLEASARPRGRGSLLAWRVPLGDPAAVLDLLRPLQSLLFTPGALVLWGVTVAALLVQALQHAPQLWAHGAQWLATPRYALLAAALYVPIKLLHELAHGLAVRRWGGQVHEAGVTLMLGMPVPYVDASAAAAFEQRGRRVAVSSAGIACELAIASLALPLWLLLDDGLARDAAFVTLFVTGVSTLLFNANPLQRLDGYYIATDLLDLPNLAPRSRQWWLDVLTRRLLRVPGVEPMVVARGEARWLALYAPLAWGWGLVIAALAAVWIGQWSFVLGMACGAVLGWQMLLRPVWRVIAQLRRAALLHGGTARRWRRLAAVGVAALLLALALPLPQRTLVRGVVWPAEQAQLRAGEDGFVEALALRDGDAVRAGDLVLQLRNPRLQAELARQQARVAALETALFDALPAGETRAGDAHAELEAARAELERLEQRLQALAVRAEVPGIVALPSAADLPAQYVAKGRLIGQVLTGAPPTVRVALPESQARELQRHGSGVSVRLAGTPSVERAAALQRDSVGAVMQLPSAALSIRHGGDVATDPKDDRDLRPLAPVVLLDVQLAADGVSDSVPDRLGTRADAMPGRIGERAWIRFDHGLAPSAWQLAQGLRQRVLHGFNPQF